MCKPAFELWSIILTLSALFGLGAMVYFTMAYATRSAEGEAGLLPKSYWLVALFGAVGGAIGGVLRNDNKLALCRIEAPDKVHLGVVGDISFGLGGACAIVFLFGNTLRIDPKDTVLLISLSFIAGTSGKSIVELAAKRLLGMAKAVARDTATTVAQKVAQETVKAVSKDVEPVASAVYADAAADHIDKGENSHGLELADRALSYEPQDIYAHIQKGRALSRLGRVKEALTTIEEALSIQPNNAYCLYNKACYMALLGMSSEEILAGLSKALQEIPELRRDAETDSDLDSLRDLPEFKRLLSDAAGSP
jgi:tetratricopeptide (TPR) repeat protein